MRNILIIIVLSLLTGCATLEPSTIPNVSNCINGGLNEDDGLAGQSKEKPTVPCRVIMHNRA